MANKPEKIISQTKFHIGGIYLEMNFFKSNGL